MGSGERVPPEPEHPATDLDINGADVVLGMIDQSSGRPNQVEKRKRTIPAAPVSSVRVLHKKRTLERNRLARLAVYQVGEQVIHYPVSGNEPDRHHPEVVVDPIHLVILHRLERVP